VQRRRSICGEKKGKGVLPERDGQPCYGTAVYSDRETREKKVIHEGTKLKGIKKKYDADLLPERFSLRSRELSEGRWGI